MSGTPQMPFSDSPDLPPPRSLIGVSPVPPEDGGGLLITCDCATTTHLIIEDIDTLTEAQEFPFTCDGCHSTTWITAVPMGRADA